LCRIGIEVCQRNYYIWLPACEFIGRTLKGLVSPPGMVALDDEIPVLDVTQLAQSGS
jgi:hypothetical protein